MKEFISNESKRIEEDATYSAKGHFYAAQFWTGLNFWIGIPTTIIAAVAGCSALADFNNNEIYAGVLALLVAGLSAVMTFLSPKDRALAHHNAGNAYKALENDVRIFYTIDFHPLDEKKMQESLHGYNLRRNALNTESPQIPKRFFKKARKGIEAGEAHYKID